MHATQLEFSKAQSVTMRPGNKQGRHGSSTLQKRVLPCSFKKEQRSRGSSSIRIHLNLHSSPIRGRNRGSRSTRDMFQIRSATENCTCSPSLRTSCLSLSQPGDSGGWLTLAVRQVFGLSWELSPGGIAAVTEYPGEGLGSQLPSSCSKAGGPRSRHGED